jgi:hypothetical protein
MLIFDGGANSISGLAVGGLPSGVVTGTNIANNTLTSSQLAASQILTATNMPTGSVIQTVSYTLENSQTFASGGSTQNAQATNITANITPQFSSSRIKISVFIPWQYAITSVSNPSYGYFFIWRGSTNITSPSGFGSFGNQVATGTSWGNSAFAYIDSPASTSSLTYTIYVAFGNSTGSFYIVPAPGFMYNSGATILLEEIR